MSKLKIAWYWCASCGGCEESLVDLGERLLDLLGVADIVFCPVAMDFKREDIENMPDGSIDIALINGGIRLEEHREMVELLRKKAKIVIAYGACSSWGGIPGLANLYEKDEILKRKYLEVPTVVNPEGVIPKPKTKIRINGTEGEIELTEFLDRVLPLDRVIEVDYYIPGCPPTPDVLWNAIQQLLSDNPPPKGSVLGALSRSLCDECPRNDTKPEKLLIKEIKRTFEIIPDPDKCLLAQGVICLGPVTRGGCGARCISANMPCSGCFGPLDNIIDYGGKAASFIASILDFTPMEEEEYKKTLDKFPDWVGVLYRYYLAASRLGGKVKKGGDEG